MIDVHCHILSSIDDGAKDIEESVKMLKIAENDGVSKIIATPHFYRGYYENCYCEVEKQTQKLNEEAKNRGINVEILPGQEIFLDKYTVDYYKKGIISGLNGSDYMLLEMDMMEMPKDALDIIYELKLLGVKPIIAHPERYAYVNENLMILNRFIEEECLFQVNSGSLKGIFGKKVKKTAESIVKSGLCNFIGSDAHSTGRRNPKLRQSYEMIKNIDTRKMQQIVENSSKIYENIKISYQNNKIKEKKRFFAILFR